MIFKHKLVEGKMIHQIVREQTFNPEDYEPAKLKAMDQYGLLKTEKNLAAIFDERGARANDELVINAYQFVKNEMRKRGIEVEFHKVLDRLTASEEKGAIRKYLMQGIRKIQELGPIIWKPKFVSVTGSALFVDDKGKRMPNDLDTVIRDDEINATLLLKIDRIFEKYFEVTSHPIAEPFGPNWRHLPIWDLALVPRKDITIEEINEPGFVKEFYEATETGVQADARKSAQEDEIKMNRYFFGMKPTKGYLTEEKMSVDGLMKFIGEDDYPILVEKKYDGAKLIVFKDGSVVTIYTDDGGNVTNRLPKCIAAIKKLKVKSAIFEFEAELWREGKHMPREMMAGYLHEKGEPNDDDVMMNAYGVVYKDEDDLHKKNEQERRDILVGIKPFGQMTNDKPDMTLQLNLVKSVIAKNAKEFRRAVEDLRRRPGSEGVVIKKSKAVYYLNRNSKGGWYKLHNTELIAGIVVERIGTKTAGVYTYRYGIDPGKYKVRPGDLGEVKDKEYMEVGTSFSTNKKVERGGIIEIEFSTLNCIQDERSGTVQVTAWVPRFMRELEDKTEPDGVDVVVGRARKEGILREKRITKEGKTLYESKDGGGMEVENMSMMEYQDFIGRECGMREAECKLYFGAEAWKESLEEIEELEYHWMTEEEGKSEKIDVGYRAIIKKASAAAAKLPKYWAVIENHFRIRSQHKDFRVKMNSHAEGKTLTDQPEGSITEDIETIEQGRKWQAQVKYKFRPDMDPTTHVVVVKKAKQPVIWLKYHDKFMGKYAAAEPGSVTATRFGHGVVILEDEGFAYPTIKKPYFEEFFLNMKKYKGRMVFRLIPVGARWEKPPKGKLQWQVWMSKDQIPYLLSRRARVKADYIPDESRTTASGLPPDWEKKIPIAMRWWERGLSRSEKLAKMDEAYNYLIEKKVLKGNKLKESESKTVKYIVRRNWWKGQCFPLNTLVMTASGNVAVQKIRTNDMIFDGDGKKTRVVSTDQIFFNRAAKLKIKGEKYPVVVSPNHPILVKRDNHILYCRAEDCQRDDLVKVPVFRYSGCEHYGPIESVRRFRFCSHKCQMENSWRERKHGKKRERILLARKTGQMKAAQEKRLKMKIVKDGRFEEYLWGMIYGDCSVRVKRGREKAVNVRFDGREDTAEIFDKILDIPVCEGKYRSGFGTEGIWKEFNLPIERYEFLRASKRDFYELTSRINGNFWSFLGGFFDAEGSICFPKIKKGRAQLSISQYNDEVISWLQRELVERGINARVGRLKTRNGGYKLVSVCVNEQKSIEKFARNILAYTVHRKKRKLLSHVLKFNPHFSWVPVLKVTTKPWDKTMYSIETESKTILTRKLAVHNTVVRGMPVQYWDLLIDSGKGYLDEFRLESDPLIKEKLERGIPAVHRKITKGTPKGGAVKEWMTFEGEIPPGHPEWGNPNKRIPAYKKIIDRGTANWIEETDMFHHFSFDGKGLSGMVVIKRESPAANIWVMKVGKKPGEEM